jgi:protein-S-isoprenylcysteine O-methyltransferase Ste14
VTTDATLRLGERLFRLRGWTPVPLLVVGLALGRPTVASVLLGIAVTVAGELIRWQSVAHIGSTSRTRAAGVGPLITDGPYARTRNPLYLGNLLIGLGMVWACAVPLLLPVFVILFALQYSLVVRWEESRLAVEHGEAFAGYLQRVPRWFPTGRSRATGASAGRRPFREVLRSERSTLIVQVAVYAAVAARVALEAFR